MGEHPLKNMLLFLQMQKLSIHTAFHYHYIYDNLLDDELSSAISSLPEDFRTVIILCDIEGYTYDEIADFVDVPVGTVRSRLHRARKMLFTKLYDYAGDKGYVNKSKDKR